MKETYIAGLKDAIRNMHGCEADHLATFPVTERFRGAVVWTGEVELFQLIGHPNASRCYAWSHREGDRDQHQRFVAVLEIPPVDSPETAVRAAIASQR